MNFDDEKLNNQQEKQSITWDELLSDDNLDLASLAKKTPDFNEDDLEELVNDDDDEDLLGEEVDTQSISDLIDEEDDSEEDAEEDELTQKSEASVVPPRISKAGINNFEDKKSNTGLIISGILAAVFVACGLFAFAYFKGMTPFSKADTDTLLQESELGIIQKPQNSQPESVSPSSSLTSDASAQNKSQIGAKDNAKETQKDEESSSGKKVTVTIGDIGRLDPFMPFEGAGIDASGPNLPPASLLLPPEELGSQPQAQELLKTTVSGIMYDKIRPSAIINVNGVDHFVQRGDRLADYLVLNISRDTVTLRNGHNIFSARVGELIEPEEINYTGVYNLGKKFGGQTPPPSRNGYISSDEIRVNVKKQ